MIIYKDAITDDEMFSSAFPIKEAQGGMVYEVDCSMVQHRKGVDVNTGANASAEGGEEQMEDGVETINNVVFSSQLNSTVFDKASYRTYIKGYMKATKLRLQEEGKSATDIKEFEKGAMAVVQNLIANFKDYEFYTGRSMAPEGMVALLNYREDGVTPYLTFWKHGLIEMKV